MPGSDANRYKSLQGLAPANQIVSLCCLLVLVNLSINWISFKECSSFFYLVPLLLLLVIFKLIWDNNNRVYSIGAVLLTTSAFAILYGNIVESQYVLQPRRNVAEHFALSAQILSIERAGVEHQDREASGFNIFFIETNSKKEVLTNRELCAIESAAKHNPNAKVVVLTMNAKTKPNRTSRAVEAQDDTDLLDAYPNIRLRSLNPVRLFKGTPLFQWWQKGVWKQSPNILAHISDAARLALLWKYGGFYSDLDTIAVKPLQPLTLFASVGHMIEYGRNSMGNGVMSFERAHPMLLAVMAEFDKNYKPNAWGNTGPVLVQNVMKTYCQNSEIFQSQLIDEATFERLVSEHRRRSSRPKWQDFKYSNVNSTSTNKCDVLIYPSSFYYPFDYERDLKHLFEPNSTLNIVRLMSTYSVHFYGKMSAKYQVSVGDNSLYEYLARHNCPNVYARVKKQKDMLI